MSVMNLDKLDAWVRAKDFALTVYKEVVPHLPNDEKWNLIQQLKRSAQSIPANIAEGHRRYHFLDEVQSHMALAHDLGFISNDLYKRMTAQAESYILDNPEEDNENH